MTLTRRDLVNNSMVASISPSLVGSLRRRPTIVEHAAKTFDLPAIGDAVITAGKLLYSDVYGVRRYRGAVEVKLGDKWHIGSCTKAITATLCGILIDEQKLRFDTTLGEAFPELVARMPGRLKEVTLEHLLSHRSGITSESWPVGKTFSNMHSLPGKPMAQRAEYAKLILQEKLINEPGEKYTYSNRNFALAGIMAERAVHKPWEQLIIDRISKALGMKGVGFGAMGTRGKEDQPLQHNFHVHPVPVEPSPTADNPPCIAPAGTLHCPLDAWSQFILDQLASFEGKSKLISKGTAERLHTPPFGGDYMGGWIKTARSWAKGPVYTHSGSNNMNFCTVWMSPEDKFAVLVTTNCAGDNAQKACDRVSGDVIYASLERDKKS